MSLLNELVTTAIDVSKTIKGKSTQKVPDYIHQQRKAICDTCPKQGEHMGVRYCTLCNCVTDVKTEYADEQCADDPPKWLEYYEK